MTVRERKVVVIDWDGTLAYSCQLEAHLKESSHLPFWQMAIGPNGEQGPIALVLRPKVSQFLQSVAKLYDLGLWSFGVPEYINEVLEITQLRPLFRFVRTRDDSQGLLKDLYMIEQDLSRIIIVDDDASFGFLNPYNCIKITTWSPFNQVTRGIRSTVQELQLVFQLISYRFEAIQHYGPFLTHLRVHRLRCWAEEMSSPGDEGELGGTYGLKVPI